MVCPVQRGCVYVGHRDRAASQPADRATGLRAAWLWTASILRTLATGPRANGDRGSDGGGPTAVRGTASTAAATLRGATKPAGGVSAGCSRQVRPRAREPSRQHPADLDACPIRTVRVRAPETAPSTLAARMIGGQVGRRRHQLITLIGGPARSDPDCLWLRISIEPRNETEDQFSDDHRVTSVVGPSRWSFHVSPVASVWVWLQANVNALRAARPSALVE